MSAVEPAIHILGSLECIYISYVIATLSSWMNNVLDFIQFHVKDSAASQGNYSLIYMGHTV